ncbi:unnamed protein product [Heligmosomoides polygyrus]|uniref:RNA helicase n=1 Tax=Heligmosomoides polygyrus TaxID=6339 RepID=A0A183FRG9_HELPZ|nr:unnamed protein product [Heligmosomoides polygyrus]
MCSAQLAPQRLPELNVLWAKMGLKRAYIIILFRPYRRIVSVARKKVLTESDREDETPCAKPLDVRGKYLPMIFEPQINLDFLQNNVARNLQVDSKHYIHTLRQIQQYMIPLVLNEIPFVVAGPAGAGKTTGYLLPLVNKLVELKEIEVLCLPGSY